MEKSFLTEIEISGYKSFNSNAPQKITLSQINIIIGANGAGKSNFISFFTMLNYMMTGQFQLFVAQNGFASAMMYLGPKQTPVMYGKLSFTNKSFENDYLSAINILRQNKLDYYARNMNTSTTLLYQYSNDYQVFPHFNRVSNTDRVHEIMYKEQFLS